MRVPKIVLYDVETTTMKVHTWGLYPKYISHDNIIEDWSIICGAWKTLGSEKVHAVKIDPKDPKNDLEVVTKLREVLVDADMVIAHNGDKFDWRKLNARLICHGLDPLPKIPSCDTLKEVRKIAAFSSNRLDFLAKKLIGEGKLSTGYGLWLDVMNGNKKALKDMVEYCKVDVVRLEQVYMKLRPYMRSHPHVGAIYGEDRNYSCPKCGSELLTTSKTRYSALGVEKVQKQCTSCHAYSTHPVTKNYPI
jgi:DNA polymerase elongation subunit (family B)